MQSCLTKQCLYDNVPLILAVEDDPDNQLLLQHAITMFGWKYVSTDSAFDAFEISRNILPDLILLDIVMPKINGLEIAALLKSNIHTYNIPLIAVTGLARKIEQDLIFAVGFSDYICKPYFLEDLKKIITANLTYSLSM